MFVWQCVHVTMWSVGLCLSVDVTVCIRYILSVAGQLVSGVCLCG